MRSMGFYKGWKCLTDKDTHNTQFTTLFFFIMSKSVMLSLLGRANTGDELLQNENLELFADDVQKIVESFAREGYKVSPEDACSAWTEYSDTYCAGWLCMGKKGLTQTEIKELMKYFKEQTALDKIAQWMQKF